MSHPEGAEWRRGFGNHASGICIRLLLGVSHKIIQPS